MFTVACSSPNRLQSKTQRSFTDFYREIRDLFQCAIHRFSPAHICSADNAQSAIAPLSYYTEVLGRFAYHLEEHKHQKKKPTKPVLK